MTNEQINAAIARECGWKSKEETNGMPWCWGRTRPDGRIEVEINAPNYCTDLNTMHDAESMLVRTGPEFSRWLLEIVSRDAGQGIWYAAGSFAHVHATARQRAEAFLRTLGKWEEGE